MRLLHVIPTYLPAVQHGGPIFAVHGLARALAELGHEVTVFTTDAHTDAGLGTPVVADRVLDGVRVRTFPARFPRRLAHAPALATALRREITGFDLVHLHSVFLWPTMAAARFAEAAGVPYLLAPRGMLVRELIRRRGTLRKRAWISLFERRTIEHATALHATGELEAFELTRFGWRLPPVEVVPNGLDAAELVRDPALPLSPAVERALAGGPFVLFLGRLSWKKGLDRLIPALAHAPALRLIVAGNDEEGLTPRLEELAREHGVTARVCFVGPAYDQDKAALLREAAVFCLPSYSENFGNAVLEAMAVGCPVVVTPEVGLAAEVARSECGFVTRSEPEVLAAALSRFVDDPAVATAMGERGAVVVRERYGWKTVAARMAEVYRRIVTSSAHP